MVPGMRALADAGLVLDTANPTAPLLADVVRLTDRVPNLRVVIDHLPRLELPADATGRAACRASLKELGKRPQVYVKVSGVLQRVEGRVPVNLSFYRDKLDEIWDVFGEDRLIYGSDWPNSDQWGTYPQGLKIVEEYFHAKGLGAAEKYFWKNSMAAYRWIKRDATQPATS